MKREEVKEDPNLMANGRFQCLVAFGRFHHLVALARFRCLVALARFQCLAANERRRRSTFSHLPTFPPTILLKLSFFPLVLRFYFTVVLNRYLHIFILFFDL
jgi:hypothetical protein